MSKQDQGSKKKMRKVAYLKREAKRRGDDWNLQVLRSGSSTIEEVAKVLEVKLN